jgi:3-phosphoshikimate 1-carboxyvinyltransferase
VVSAAEVPALIDEVPILAVAAALGHGELVVRDAAELRVKESDRIASLAEGLRRMGGARGRASRTGSPSTGRRS